MPELTKEQLDIMEREYQHYRNYAKRHKDDGSESGIDPEELGVVANEMLNCIDYIRELETENACLLEKIRKYENG